MNTYDELYDADKPKNVTFGEVELIRRNVFGDVIAVGTRQNLTSCVATSSRNEKVEYSLKKIGSR
jgi:hypothetical protein